MKNIETYIAGKSGLAMEAYYYLKEAGWNVCGFADVCPEPEETFCDNLTVISDREICGINHPINVFIAIADGSIKKKIHDMYSNNEMINFPCFISDKALLYGNVDIEEGAIVAPGSIITCGAHIGKFAIINYNVSIGHGTTVGDYSIVNPGCSLSGNVKVGRFCLVGTGARILQGLCIADRTVIGAGAVVTKNITGERQTVVGVPAKPILK